MIETSLIAWATTSSNSLGADAGITVETSVKEGGTVQETSEVARETAAMALDDEGGDLDVDAADTILDGMGYSRIDPWMRSGDQWAARVEALA